MLSNVFLLFWPLSRLLLKFSGAKLEIISSRCSFFDINQYICTRKRLHNENIIINYCIITTLRINEYLCSVK